MAVTGDTENGLLGEPGGSTEGQFCQAPGLGTADACSPGSLQSFFSAEEHRLGLGRGGLSSSHGHVLERNIPRAPATCCHPFPILWQPGTCLMLPWDEALRYTQISKDGVLSIRALVRAAYLGTFKLTAGVSMHMRACTHNPLLGGLGRGSSGPSPCPGIWTPFPTKPGAAGSDSVSGPWQQSGQPSI